LSIFDPNKTSSPPASVNLSPTDFSLFPKLKVKLKGLRFEDVAEIQEAVTDELKKAQTEEFSAAFQKLYDRAQKPVCMPVELILNKNKVSLFNIYQRILKIQS
jgi:hypothetical protein